MLFKTDRFNLSKVQPHFINPCCFGEDFATWLRGKLGEHGIEVSGLGQEDWGWYLKAHSGETSYLLAVSGNSDDGVSDQGEWRVIVEKRRSIWNRFAGKGKISPDDPVANVVEGILRSQTDFQGLRREME